MAEPKGIHIDRWHPAEDELTSGKSSLSESPSIRRRIQVDDERAHPSP
jgi:hypothetical protein